MKCRYKFAIEGKIKPTVLHPINVRGLEYDFLTNENGVITHISVTTGHVDKRSWPIVQESNEAGVKLEINIPSEPHYPFILQELQVIEGLLSIYGMEKIDYENFHVEWLPNSEDEKNQLAMYNFSTGKNEIEDSSLPPLSFDLLARPIIGAPLGEKSEVTLSFFRKGRIDVKNSRYIEAIYDFYFVMESAYGDGKFKKAQIVQSFMKSKELVSIVKESLQNPCEIIQREHKLRLQFQEKYAKKSVEQVISEIVELRGFLHHHTAKRKDIWHPEKHKEYEMEAIFLQDVCFKIAFKVYGEVVFNEDTVAKYQAAFLGKAGV